MGTHLALYVVVTFAAINKIKRYSHEPSSKLLNAARRTSNPVVLQRSTHHDPDPRGSKEAACYGTRWSI